MFAFISLRKYDILNTKILTFFIGPLQQLINSCFPSSSVPHLHHMLLFFLIYQFSFYFDWSCLWHKTEEFINQSPDSWIFYYLSMSCVCWLKVFKLVFVRWKLSAIDLNVLETVYWQSFLYNKKYHQKLNHL